MTTLYELRRIARIGSSNDVYHDTVMPFPSLDLAVRYANARAGEALFWLDGSSNKDGATVGAYDNPNHWGIALWQIDRVVLSDEPVEIVGLLREAHE